MKYSIINPKSYFHLRSYTCDKYGWHLTWAPIYGSNSISIPCEKFSLQQARSMVRFIFIYKFYNLSHGDIKIRLLE